jgi:signal transduction histidine kinase
VRYSIRLMGDLEAMRRGEPQRIDVRDLPDGREKDALLASGVRSYLAVPMVAGGELIGAISFGGETADFPDEQVHIAREVAAQLAIAITQAQLLERVTRQAGELEKRVEARTAELNAANRELRLLHEATLEISKAPDSAVALMVLLEKVCEFTGWVFGQTWLPAPGGARLVLGPAWTRSVPGLEDFRRENEALGFAPSGGALERVWKTRSADWVWDLQPAATAVRRPLMLQAGMRAWIGFPVLADGEVVAVLDFFDTEHRPRDEGVLRLIAILASQIGPVIVAKRSAEEIRRLNAELQATNKELESFSYSVSHDLRAPLRAIDGYARMLEEDYRERLDAEGTRLLGVVRDSSRRMGQLIDDLLAFSQLGRQEPARRPVDMTGLVREVVAEHAAINGVALDVATLPAASVDRSLMKQVWLNLVGNALKYSGKHAAPRVEIGGREEGEETVYWVRDNGVGFDMRYAGKLFGVFQRLHRAEEFDGTGVGLAIVQRVVTRHGGRVWAEGKLGEGACFYFALPR